MVRTEFMNFAFKLEYYFFLISNTDWSFEQGLEFKSILTTHDVDCLIGYIMEDKWWYFDLFALNVFINILFLNLDDVLGCKDSWQHLRGYINFEWGSFFPWSICLDIQRYALLLVNGKCWVSNGTLEGLDNWLPSWWSWVEEIEIQDRDDEELRVNYCLLHRWLGFINDETNDRHKVVIAVIHNFNLHGCNLTFDLCLQLDLLS